MTLGDTVEKYKRVSAASPEFPQVVEGHVQKIGILGVLCALPIGPFCKIEHLCSSFSEAPRFLQDKTTRVLCFDSSFRLRLHLRVGARAGRTVPHTWVQVTSRPCFSASARESVRSLSRSSCRAASMSAGIYGVASSIMAKYFAVDEPPCQMEVLLREFPFDPTLPASQLQAYLRAVARETRVLMKLRHPNIACVIGNLFRVVFKTLTSKTCGLMC